MGSNASGVYMIDSKYRIVDYNRVAKRDCIHNWKEEKKCYQCLMNLGAPCEVCPVNNQIEGPHTYLDRSIICMRPWMQWKLI